MEQTIGLYIHIPFCVRKCPYCDFYSLPFTPQQADRYLAALIQCMNSHPFGKLKADTLFLGGGTPSLFGVTRLAALVEAAADALGLGAEDEITLEANPGTLAQGDLQALRKSGFNRVSLGVQSMVDTELADLGRIHTANQARAAIQDAYAAGFSHISADVMLAIPGQTRESLAITLDALTQLPVDHLSAYLLKIEEGTAFAINNIAPHCPDEEAAANLYLDCTAALESKGFETYEISNFAKPGGQCRHNLKYWHCQPYLGLGPSAHSYMNGQRFSFDEDLAAFCSASSPFDQIIPDGEGGDFAEYAMLRLRLAEGLQLSQAKGLYGIDTQEILTKAKSLEQQGLVVLSQDTIALTPKGRLLSNAVTGHLLF